MTAPLSSATVDQAEAIRREASNRYLEILADSALSDVGKQVQCAKVYMQAMAQMQGLRDATGGDHATAVQSATSRAFGIDDLAPTGSANRAQVSLTYRDALDRADLVKDVDTAKVLLQRATDTGDETLARAVANRAWTLRGGNAGWFDVLEQYVTVRPAAATAINQLIDLTKPQAIAPQMFAWVLPKPSPLVGIQDSQIRILAEGS